MERSEKMVIPTDKTNSFRLSSSDKYVKWVQKDHIQYGKEIPRSIILEVVEKAGE
jgi:hypothetical protein